jgi:hypothetical protein
MLKVFVAQNPTEAHLVLGLLTCEGIDAELRGEALFTTLNGGGAAQGLLPSVWAQRPDQYRAAAAVVARYQATEAPADEPSWRCPSCAEAHGAQFTDCWQCGTARS